MTFSLFELSTWLGNPVWLYRFAQGDTVWRYTSAGSDFDWGGYTWTAEKIRHSKIAQTSEKVKDNVSLSFARSNVFVQQWLGGVPESLTTVEIIKVHRGDPDAEPGYEWSGRVLGLDPSNEPELTLVCEPSMSTRRRIGLQEKLSRFCRHALYDQEPGTCMVDKAVFAVASLPTSLDGATLTAPEAAAYADGWFTGGYIVGPDGSMRYVIAHAGDQLVLARSHPVLAGEIANAGWDRGWDTYWDGVPVTLYPGCAHDLDTCIDKFDNRANHGGFPWKASKNPFGGNSIV